MKILFISRLYPNIYDEKDGAVMHSQVKELIDRGNEVIVVSPKPYVPVFMKNLREKWKHYSQLPLNDTYKGIKVFRPTFFDLPYGLNRTDKYKNLIKSSSDIVQKIYKEYQFDLVHSHMAYPDNHLGCYIKEKYNVPLITTIRSTDLDISIKYSKLENLMRASLNYSDVIISPSFQLGKKLKKEMDFNSLHIGNGIYPEELKKIKDCKVVSDEIKILSISNLMESKGIQYNILAVKELVKDHPNLKYYIIGDGNYKKELLRLVHTNNLEENVVFLGALAHHEAMIHLKNCTIFSMPSWRETFGLVYLEALFYKKPILLCENQGIDGSVIKNHSAIIVEPKSSESVFVGLEKLIVNQELREKLGNNGYQIVVENYTWEKIGLKLNDLYQNSI